MAARVLGKVAEHGDRLRLQRNTLLRSPQAPRRIQAERAKGEVMLRIHGRLSARKVTAPEPIAEQSERSERAQNRPSIVK